MTQDLIEYDLAVPPKCPITISLDVNPSEVELALATNAASLRSATLIALLTALVVANAASAAGDTPVRPSGSQEARRRRPKTEIAPLPLISNIPNDSPSKADEIVSQISLVAATLPGALMPTMRAATLTVSPQMSNW
jgi:hypothetical protein